MDADGWFEVRTVRAVRAVRAARRRSIRRMSAISVGHTAPGAERQASRLPAFQTADPAHIDLFAAGWHSGPLLPSW